MNIVKGGRRGYDWRKIEKNALVSKYPYAGETHKYDSLLTNFLPRRGLFYSN
jgi:hypothetical protein